MPTRRLVLFLSAFLLSCAGKPRKEAAARPAPADAERQPVAGHEWEGQQPCEPRAAAQPCGGAARASAPEVDVREWARWTKLTDKPILSKGHGGKYVEIFVEPRFVEAYKAGKTPVGMTTCKPNYKDAEGKQFVNLTCMKKMSRGYDPDNGDWWYGVLDERAATAMSQGKVEMCIECHDNARHDHLFGPAKLFNVR